MIKVYHLSDTATSQKDWLEATVAYHDPRHADRCARLFARGCYTLVAEVETDQPEVAWSKTNNVDNSWSMDVNPGVTVKAPLHISRGKTYGLRSTSIGDIIECNGVRSVASQFGFTELED